MVQALLDLQRRAQRCASVHRNQSLPPPIFFKLSGHRTLQDCNDLHAHCRIPFRLASQNARKLVLRRTSEHWWEDEEEFDAITEVVVPKRLYLVEAPKPVGTSTGEGPNWGPVNDVTAAALLAMSDIKFACGFSSSKLKDGAAELWRQLRQDGAPFFKKVRTREALDVLEDTAAGSDAVNTAAEALWGEICGKTWRVELDYGLADAAADPRDDLLLVCSWSAASRLLSHAGLSANKDAAQFFGCFVLHVSGYNASGQGGGGSEFADVSEGMRSRSWRNLLFRLQPLEPPAATAATAAATAAL